MTDDRKNTDNQHFNYSNADHSPLFTDGKLWKKFNKYAKKIGLRLMYGVLLLYYALQDRNIPIWAKTVIGSALGYFILPIDAIPDFVPITGYVDDLGVVLLAISQVALFMTPETKAKAKERLEDWFDIDDENDYIILDITP